MIHGSELQGMNCEARQAMPERDVATKGIAICERTRIEISRIAKIFCMSPTVHGRIAIPGEAEMGSAGTQPIEE